MGTIYMHKLQTARLALTLLLTAGPLSAFADDGYFGRQPQGGLLGPTDLPELPSYTQSASSLTQTVSATSTAPAHISEAVAAATNTGVPNAAVTNNGARNTANGTQHPQRPNPLKRNGKTTLRERRIRKRCQPITPTALPTVRGWATGQLRILDPVRAPTALQSCRLKS